ncbi:MBL fold metallo-hydrolase [Variimorphobacter saccharofermentans]|nr:MBL fold metallo-hydrolase [Variimorphobacter saccharofermentans]
MINIGNRIANNYLLLTPKGWLAIDTGYPGGFRRFVNGLAAHSIDISDINYIFLTHAHDDHAGFLGELMNATDAQLIVHTHFVERLLSGHNQRIGGCSGVLAKVFVESMRLVGKGKHEFPAIDVSKQATIWDGTTQPLMEQDIPLKILALPGHTSDSIGLLSEDGELFCGDAAMNGFPSVNRNIIWIENLDDYCNSWDIMIKAKARVIYPSHGKPFSSADLDKYRPYLQKIVLR